LAYCIADRLMKPYEGNRGRPGLFFTGANGYRLNEIISGQRAYGKIGRWGVVV